VDWPWLRRPVYESPIADQRVLKKRPGVPILLLDTSRRRAILVESTVEAFAAAADNKGALLRRSRTQYFILSRLAGASVGFGNLQS
jgi:hypothetical protein